MTAIFRALQDARILITGHTGFKGTWLSRLLNHLGAYAYGVSLAPEQNSLFSRTNGVQFVESYFEDITEFGKLADTLKAISPDLIIHMAAQPLVRRSYKEPIMTFRTNVLGTAHVLELVRSINTAKGVLVVTSDKVYRNLEEGKAFSEEDALGGSDPYSASKSATEMVVTAWREIFNLESAKIIVSARAGNIIGGGDYSEDRLLPDLLRSFRQGNPAVIRNPQAVRPWQHVLDPLWGYLIIASRMLTELPVSNAYNFGPLKQKILNVGQVSDLACQLWGPNASWTTESSKMNLPESKLLFLNSTKARQELDWLPLISQSEAVEWTIKWEKEVDRSSAIEAMDNQISEYLELIS